MGAVKAIEARPGARALRYGLAAALLAMVAMWLLPEPASAQSIAKRNLGYGVLEGKITYAPPGLPPATAACEPTSFTFTASSEHAFFLNTVITGFLGPIQTISGTGSSECANGARGAGPFTLMLDGLGPTGSKLDCPPDPEVDPPLTGGFERDLSKMSVDVEGLCMDNNFVTPPVRFDVRLGLSPAGEGGGATERVTEEDFSGAFRVVTWVEEGEL